MTRDDGALALAERALCVLEEGSFSATYKFALFTAILDVCIENTSTKGSPPTSITTRQLAEKVVELYWNHSAPYGDHGVLRQGGPSGGGQAEIVRRIERTRARWTGARNDTLFRVRVQHPRDYARLVDFVEWKLIEMPIPRLQVLGREEDRFLYDYNWTPQIRQSTVSAHQRGGPSDFDNNLLLKPGVGANLARLNGVLRPLFYREWALMVAGMNRLPEAELETFLFGTERVSLNAVREPLVELQERRCFYCDGQLGDCEVDHFIPWVRYPDDGLDNLVAAHRRCNNSKRDFLAAAEHVERWAGRARNQGAALSRVAADARWRRDPNRSLSVASALYLRLPPGARLWQRPSVFAPVDRDRIAAALDAR